MPGLKATIGADTNPFNQELAKAVITSRDWAKQVQKNVQTAYAAQYTMGDAKKILASSGGAMEKLHVSGRGLQHLFHMMGVEGSGAVGLLVHALASPLFLAISAAAGAMWLFNKALQALGPIADTLGIKSLAPNMEHFREKTIEARAAVLEWADGLRRGRSEADALNDSLRSLTNTTEAWASADDKVAEAQKALDLAKIKAAVTSGQISPEEGRNRSNAVEAAFDQDKLKRANDARNVVTHAVVETAEKAEAGAAAAKAKVPGLNDAYIAAQGEADANAARIKNAEENLKTLQAKRKKLGSGDFAAMGGNAAMRTNQDVLDAATNAQPGLLAGAKGAKAELDKAEKEAEKLRDEAAAKRREADMRMTKGAAEFKADKDVAALKAQTRALEDVQSKKALVQREHHAQQFSLTSQQKVGAYAAMPPGMEKMNRTLEGIHACVKNLNPPSFSPVRSTPAQFGPGGR
jgi:hypothetical protein